MTFSYKMRNFLLVLCYIKNIYQNDKNIIKKLLKIIKINVKNNMLKNRVIYSSLTIFESENSIQCY